MTDQPPPPPGSVRPDRLHLVDIRHRLRPGRWLWGLPAASAGWSLSSATAGRAGWWLRSAAGGRDGLPAGPSRRRSRAAHRGLHALGHPCVGVADRLHPARDPGGDRVGSAGRHPRDRLYHQTRPSTTSVTSARPAHRRLVRSQSGSPRSLRSFTGSGISVIGRAQRVRASASRS